MCFSAGASFGISAVLTVAGAISLKKVKNPLEIPFASIPLIFAVQQFSEGFVWLALTQQKYAHLLDTAIDSFMFFAWVVWPFWVPLAMGLIEPNATRRKIINIALSIGFIVSMYLAYSLLTYQPSAIFNNHHIKYEMPPVNFVYVGQIMYALATIIPAFVSSIKWNTMLGIVLSISLLVSILYFRDNVLSVWCFFAAIISIII
jgi:hypothetical protein